MSAADDTLILPPHSSGGRSPNGRTPHGVPTPPLPRRDQVRPAAGPPADAPSRLLTAVLHALSVWPT